MKLTQDQKEAVGAAIAVAMLVVAALGWYGFYVQPHDEFRGEVLACMENRSEAEYHRCVEFVKAELSDSETIVRPQQ